MNQEFTVVWHSMAGTVKENKKQICTARIFTNLKHPVEKKERKSRSNEKKSFNKITIIIFWLESWAFSLCVINKCRKKRRKNVQHRNKMKIMQIHSEIHLCLIYLDLCISATVFVFNRHMCLFALHNNID